MSRKGNNFWGAQLASTMQAIERGRPLDAEPLNRKDRRDLARAAKTLQRRAPMASKAAAKRDD